MFLKKTKNIPIIWSSNSTPGYISEENEDTSSKRYLHLNVHNNIICNSQDMEATLVSTDGWMDKEDVIYMQWNITQPWKEWNFAICNNMNDLEDIMLSEISQTEKDQYCMLSLIFGIWKIKQMKICSKTEIDSQI